MNRIYILLVFCSCMMYADLVSLDLNFSSLGSLSKMSDQLNGMVELEKKLDKLPVSLSSGKEEKSLRPYLNQGTKELEKKYPWLYEIMDNMLMNEENGEAYAAGSAYFKVLGDLNGDGTDEIYLHSQGRCGASMCNYRVFQIDVKHKRIKEVFDAYSDDPSTQTGPVMMSEWKSIFTTKCWGASQCEELIFVYDPKSHHYIEENNVVCSDENMSNAEYTNCLVDKSDILEIKLDHTFETLYQNQDDNIGKKKMKYTQSVWKQYRNAQLEMAFPHQDDPKYFWTGFNQCYYKYKNRMTKARIRELREWDKQLAESGCKAIKGE